MTPDNQELPKSTKLKSVMSSIQKSPKVKTIATGVGRQLISSLKKSNIKTKETSTTKSVRVECREIIQEKSKGLNACLQTTIQGWSVMTVIDTASQITV